MTTTARSRRNPLSPLTIVGSIDEENSMEDDNPLLTSPADDESERPDCPICLDQMQEADLRHPLQCSNRCGYNFCRSCIDSLISSSHDDYVEASDGSKQVKIFLHCPNCRADLSCSIRDTVLLRKAYQAEEEQKRQNSRLGDSMRGMQEALHDSFVKDAIEEAKMRETDFFGYQTSSSTESDSSDEEGGDDDDDDAWGVEADLINGVHQSFHSPRQISFRQDVERIHLIDPTLLGGLGDLMTEHQQEKVTDLLTSGDPDQLVKGAELLRYISEEIHPSKNRRRASKRGSVYGLIAEAQRARKKAQRNNNNNNNAATGGAGGTPSSIARARFLHRQMEMELRQQAEFLGTHPLPVRIPKSVELMFDNDDSDYGRGDTSLTFVDDVWDGTIDCFNKLTIGFDGRVRKYAQPNHRGVRNILDGDGPVRIDLEKPRVVVSSVQGDCGRQGVLKGDVVTHLNGQPWTGTAAELQDVLKTTPKGTSIRLAFNCGPAVAEALKRRSLVP